MKRFLLLALSALMLFSVFTSAGIHVSFAEEENIALGKTVYGPGSGLDFITDGNTATERFWDGGNAPASVIIDLDGFFDLKRVNVVTYYGDRRCYHYTVETSVDGIEFTEIGAKTDNANATEKGTDFPCDVTAAYLRVTLKKNSANAAVHLVEVSVYGTPNDAFTAPERPSEDPEDPLNLAYAKPVRSNSPAGFCTSVNDGNLISRWEAEDYPRYVDVDLLDNYDLSSLVLFFKSGSAQSFKLYGSLDGVRFDRLYESDGYVKTPKDGLSITFEERAVYRILRVSFAGSEAGISQRANLCEIRAYGEKSDLEVTETRSKLVFTSYEDWFKENFGTDLSLIKDGNGKYDLASTFDKSDTVKELKGIVARTLGEAYTDLFVFDVQPVGKEENDFFLIEDESGDRIRITGSDGVAAAAGLNWYLKYYCGVHISQQTKQVRMPEKTAKVGEPVRMETPLKLRYAYNYCTLSYTMAFFGYDDWRRELDWLYLNGINLILDTTATEALWVHYLQKLGYTADEAKNYVCGYAYKAWWLMGNLEGYGGTVSDSWVFDTLEMARVNQRSMTVMGARPALQMFVGAMPQSFKTVAKQTLLDLGFSDVTRYMAPQGGWAGPLVRPNVLRTDYDGYDYMARLFYDCEEFIYGQVTDFFCGDVCHEGGVIPEGLVREEMAATILGELLKYDSDGVWIIQRWWDNPIREVLDGFGEYRKTNVLVLDLNTAQTTANFTNTSKYGSKEFGGTAWILSTLDNYGGNPGMHGALQRMCSNVALAKRTSEYLKGMGMTPEGTQNNPVMMDLYWEMVWRDEAPADLDEWLRLYVERRYGTTNDSLTAAWEILYKTVYTVGNADDGATVRFVMNNRPSMTIDGGYYVPRYNVGTLYGAIPLLMNCFDELKTNECYVYDLCDVLSTYLDAVAMKTLQRLRVIGGDPLHEGALFENLAKKYLDVILLMDEVGAYSKDMMLGTWIGRAYDWMNDERTGEYDDYSEDMMVFNAKALISAWHSGALTDYANRNYNGVLREYYYASWATMFKTAIRQVKLKRHMDEYSLDNNQHFINAWNFINNGHGYRTVPANPDGDNTSRGLRAIFDYIAANYGDETYLDEALHIELPDKSPFTVCEGVAAGVGAGIPAAALKKQFVIPEGTQLRFVNENGEQLSDTDAVMGDLTAELIRDGVRVDALRLNVMNKDRELLSLLPFSSASLIAYAAAYPDALQG